MPAPPQSASGLVRLVIALALVSALYGWAIFATTFHHPGLIGPNYNTPGTDFMVFHGGIVTALRHQWSLLFDADRFTDFLNATYEGRLAFPLTYRPWVYPPSFLMLLLPFSSLSFLPAYLSFQGATQTAFAASLIVASPRIRPACLLAAACLISPAASVNVLWGQGAFLTAAVLIGGTRLLRAHSVLAGIVFGVLSVKPQHALLVPFMLLALRSWPAIASALVTSAALAVSSVLVFGLEPWRIWTGVAGHFARNVPNWDNSVHTCAVLLGANPLIANLLMVAAFIAAAAIVYWAFSRPFSGTLRLAVLLAASNIAAPHTGPYDTLMLVIAAGLVIVNNPAKQAPLAWVLWLVLWLLPLFGQPLTSPIARLAPLLIITLLAWLWRQRNDKSCDRGDILSHELPSMV